MAAAMGSADAGRLQEQVAVFARRASCLGLLEDSLSGNYIGVHDRQDESSSWAYGEQGDCLLEE